ncbi:hypothetical protein M405DRAFT_855999 [Rhizopogon salebrosus TDB-379]|nr:hypothetical protein M405DRAFT_855999 [Rhizopogon salebrosus TDB-379]
MSLSTHVNSDLSILRDVALLGSDISNIVKDIAPKNSSEFSSMSSIFRDSSSSPSHVSYDPERLASPISHPTPVTPEPQDTCDIQVATITVSTGTRALEPQVSVTLMDPPKLLEEDLDLWTRWLTLDRDAFISASPLCNQTSLGSTLHSSPMSSFPVALLPSGPTSHTVPASPRLVLLPTSTPAFPSNIDTFDRWREDVAVQVNTLAVMSQTLSVNHTDPSAEGIECANTSPPPPGSRINPSTSKSKVFLQKVKKIGGCIRRFISRGKRSEPQNVTEADASPEVDTPIGITNGSIAVTTIPPIDNMRLSGDVPNRPEVVPKSPSLLSLSYWAHL